jgi:hypothetical protein
MTGLERTATGARSPAGATTIDPMPLVGRGTSYSRVRGLVEWTLLRAYRGGWPADLVRGLGIQRPVRTEVHAVRCPGWPAGAPPIRIVFASDLHAGSTTHPTLLEEAARAIEGAKPDLLLLGGDFVFLEASPIARLAPLLARIEAPLGKFAVFGNHDLWADHDAIARALDRAGVRVLVNETVTLDAPWTGVSITGIDDPWTGIRPPAEILDHARDVRIVLVHAPSGLLLLGDARFDLMVCGHTHGGHVALPGGVPIVSVGPLSRRYPHGIHDVGGRTLVVSRGVGATEVPFRTFADPDVRVIDLGP